MHKVSIIIAAYNVEKYIIRCIDSVVKQTYRSLQIIIVNDGSTDNTLEIIKEYCNGDERIKIINQSNMGLIEARKVGFYQAEGEYVLFLDGDDWLEENSIEKLYCTVVQGNADIILFSGYISYDSNRIEQDTFNMNYVNEIKENPLKQLFLDNVLPGIVYKFIKKRYILDNNIKFPTNISYAEDVALTTSLFIHQPKIDILEGYYYNYYQRPDSITKINNNKMLEINTALKFINQELIVNKLDKKYNLEFEYFIFRHLLLGKVLRIDEDYPVKIDIYNQYKEWNIRIRENSYIVHNMKYGNLNNKIRIYLYDRNYKLGLYMDKCRKYIFV